MTSRKNINILDFNGVNVASTGMWRGEVFAISDCLVTICGIGSIIFSIVSLINLVDMLSCPELTVVYIS